MAYIKEDLKPGYKGIFVIQDHYASHHHWDLRLSFPVDSVAKSLADYRGKRPTKGVEPTNATPDKPGKVLRSWAIPKHTAPTNKPIMATETENHIMEYANFKGEIPEGYGAGTVGIYDKGTYEMDSVDYDKKYVFTLHGKKLKGTFALVKTSGKQFLWIKTKEDRKACISNILRKFASVIDYVQPTLAPNIFDLDKNPPLLKDEIRKSIIDTFTGVFSKKGLKNPLQWIKGIYLSGSITSFNYKEDADVDIDISYDPEKIRKAYSKLSKVSDEDLLDNLKDILYEKNGEKILKTPHTFSFMILRPTDYPVADGIYDVINNKWLKGPIQIPVDFDPDKTFQYERMVAKRIGKEIDIITGKILRTIDDLKIIDAFKKPNERILIRKKKLMSRLKYHCDNLNNWYDWIWKLQTDAKNELNPYFPAFNFSPNWEEKMIIFKYLVRYGYSACIKNLYKLLKNDPYLKTVDSFIPD